MFKIYDGRDRFYQWDKDRKLIVEDKTVTQVHYCNRTDECSLICEVYELDGVRVADVPNILLTDNWRINVYAYDTNYTKHSAMYDVVKRTKPADYIYTETEVLNYKDLEARVAALEEGEGVEIDLSNYYTKEEVEALIPEVADAPEEVYVGADAPADNSAKIWIDTDDTVEYATKDYVAAAITNAFETIGIAEEGAY